MGKRETFTQLTAPGNSNTINTAAYNNHTVVYKVASINTNVVVRLEGSVNGTDFANLDEVGDTTITANGTYGFKLSNSAITSMRLVFVSESGGTTATIDGSYYGE